MPEDASEVSRVHVSTVDRWWRATPNGDRAPAQFEDLSAYERFLCEGPWMDPDPCGRHLQHVLESGQWALVAVDAAGQVLGEMEVILGPDPVWGRTAHIDVLAVARDAQRTGVGSALVQEARSRAVAAGCEMLTTNPETEAIGFYRSCGLAYVLARQTAIVVPTRDVERGTAAAVSTGPVHDFGAIAAWPLALGRVQTSYATWIKGSWPIHGFTDRRTHQEGTFVDRRVHYRIRRSPWGAETAFACAWVDRSVATLDALRLLVRRAHDLGFEDLETTVDVVDLQECGRAASHVGTESILLGEPLSDRAHPSPTVGPAPAHGSPPGS